MKRTTLVLFAAFANLACRSSSVSAQTPEARVIGAINGQPLQIADLSRDKAVEMFRIQNLRPPSGEADERQIAAIQLQWPCNGITVAIQKAASDVEMQRHAISVSDAELAIAFQDYVKHANPVASMTKQQAKARVMDQALTQVLDNSADSKQVYESLLAPLGISRAEWDVMLQVGGTKEARAQLALTATADVQALANQREAILPLLEKQKLDSIVDQQLASNDKTFQSYLNEVAAQTEGTSPFGPRRVVTRKDHRDYLDSKRADWWHSSYAKLDIVLFDPSLAKTCNLAALGIHIAGQ